MYNVLSYDGRIAIMTFNKENIPLLRSWAYNAEELEKDLRDCRLKEIRLLKIKPFYIIAKAKKIIHSRLDFIYRRSKSNNRPHMSLLFRT